MQVNRIDHRVLTVADIERSVEFYSRVLGRRRIEFAGGRIALQCGRQKINLHQSGKEFAAKAQRALPGSADFCFIVDMRANGAIVSAYLRDPDGNLLEVSSYINP